MPVHFEHLGANCRHSDCGASSPLSAQDTGRKHFVFFSYGHFFQPGVARELFSVVVYDVIFLEGERPEKTQKLKECSSFVVGFRPRAGVCASSSVTIYW